VAFIAVLLPLLIMGVLLLLWGEVRRFRAGRHFVSPRRLSLRLAAGALMIVLLIAVFLGLFVLHLDAVGSRPHLFMMFWSCCMGLAVALILVMLADVREVGARYSERQKQIWSDFASFLAKQTAARHPQETQGANDQDADARG
jgi:hypothetical protein